MNKLTKIVVTLGPSSDSEEMIEKLILLGVNIFRYNFKHNTLEWHSERIERVKKIADRLGVVVGTLIDLQGPSLRINMPQDQLIIEKGEILAFGASAFENGKKGLSITHPDIINHLKPGQKLLADDGAFTFYFQKEKDGVQLRSDTTGVLKNHKSLNIPGADYPFPVLIDRDFQGLELAARKDVDFIALSFVRNARDIRIVHKEAEKYKVKGKYIAKIETQSGLDHIDEIISVADGIMVARGDLGVEIPVEEVPYFQKMMIKKCITAGKPVITATQMLQSMIDNPTPTRAEVSDMANAVYDETDCVMLSAESASGKYPLQAVEMMRRTVSYNELLRTENLTRSFDHSVKDIPSMICDTAYGLYLQHVHSNQKIAGFLVFTQTGKTAQLLSRYRAKTPIYAFTPNKKVRDMMTINFGVVPFSREVQPDAEVSRQSVREVVDFLLSKNLLQKGAKLIVLHGDYWAVTGGTSTVQLVEA